MKSWRCLRVVLCLLLLSTLAWPQKKKEEDEPKGKLEKFGEAYTKKKDGKKKDKDSDETDDHFSIWGVFDVVDIANAIANMKPGPYPYSLGETNLKPKQQLPGGVVQVQVSYFQNSRTLTGILWRYRYFYDWVGIEADLYNLREKVGSRTDWLHLGSASLGVDFISRDPFRLGAKLGVRQLLQANGTLGPEIGLRMVALPGRPLFLEGQTTTALINKRALSTVSVSMGVMHWRFEFLFGGQLLHSPAIAIEGWQTGFRLWL